MVRIKDWGNEQVWLDISISAYTNICTHLFSFLESDCFNLDISFSTFFISSCVLKIYNTNFNRWKNRKEPIIQHMTLIWQSLYGRKYSVQNLTLNSIMMVSTSFAMLCVCLRILATTRSVDGLLQGNNFTLFFMFYIGSQIFHPFIRIYLNLAEVAFIIIFLKYHRS